jgi:hypothetical protein
MYPTTHIIAHVLTLGVLSTAKYSFVCAGYDFKEYVRITLQTGVHKHFLMLPRKFEYENLSILKIT